MPDDLEAQLANTLRREAALAGVLRAVANAGAELADLFQEITLHAAKVCGADWATIFLVEGDQIRRHSNGTRGPNALRGPGTSLRPLGDSSALAKILRERVVLRFDDQSTVTDPEFEISAAAAREVGFTSAAYAPLPADGPPLGIAVFKRRVDPFTDEDVELLQAFACRPATPSPTPNW